MGIFFFTWRWKERKGKKKFSEIKGGEKDKGK